MSASQSQPGYDGERAASAGSEPSAAVEAVAASLREFVALERRTAENSFANFVGGMKVWNGQIWRRADPDGYAMVARARRALNALAAQAASPADAQPSAPEAT